MSPKDLSQADHSQVQDVSFPSGEATLAGRLHMPMGPPRATVLISGATGVRQRHYQAFAAWLVETHGIACLTYDYRDYGSSATGPLRAAKATMADWGLHDQMAARRFLRARLPGTPLWLIGHSLGALLLRFQRDLDDVERIITVASGPVHFNDHPYPYRLLAMSFWYLHPPLIARVMGYLPGKALGLGADLPRGVYWQWRRWCTTQGFTDCDIGTSLPKPVASPTRARMKFVAMADDDLIPPKTIWRSMQYYPGAPKRQLLIKPKDYGLASVGHLGPFARQNAVLWPDLVRDFTPPGGTTA